MVYCKMRARKARKKMKARKKIKARKACKNMRVRIARKK